MDHIRKRLMRRLAASGLVLVAGLPVIAHDAIGKGMLATPPNERWRTECGSCHIPYPPRLLPAQSWQRLVSQLDQHFGTDASVDAATAAELEAYLVRHAGSVARPAPPPGSVRITDTRWFRHEHDEVPPAVWAFPAVKSAANCAACHAGAGQGDFRERGIRIPRPQVQP
jgi:hypothetical protein